MSKVQIGYPYACSDPQETREAVVLLSASDYPGFSTVTVDGENYQLVETDSGSQILRGLKRGVRGKLLEPQDERQSIARRGRIIGQGDSMQLALVLSVFAKTASVTDPLILFSAAIEYPAGAPPFIDAKIKTYCSADTAEESLLRKYKAAKFVQAIALVVSARDAQILADALQTKWISLRYFDVGKNSSDEPFIVGVDEGELAFLAKKIGISSYHYQKKSPLKIHIVILALLCCIGALLIAINFRPEKNSSQMPTSAEMSRNGKENKRLTEKEMEKGLENLSEKEKAIRMLNLGLKYYKGQGVKKDAKKAIEWMQKSAALNYPRAMCYIGNRHCDGVGVEKDYKQAVKWYRKAADLEYSYAMILLGAMYYHGRGVKKDYQKSLHWYNKAALTGNASSMHLLACMYYYGIGTKKNLTLAKKWSVKASSLGYEKATKLLKKITKEKGSF